MKNFCPGSNWHSLQHCFQYPAFYPVSVSTVWCFIRKQYPKINNALLIIFSAAVSLFFFRGNSVDTPFPG